MCLLPWRHLFVIHTRRENFNFQFRNKLIDAPEMRQQSLWLLCQVTVIVVTIWQVTEVECVCKSSGNTVVQYKIIMFVIKCMRDDIISLASNHDQCTWLISKQYFSNSRSALMGVGYRVLDCYTGCTTPLCFNACWYLARIKSNVRFVASFLFIFRFVSLMTTSTGRRGQFGHESVVFMLLKATKPKSQMPLLVFVFLAEGQTRFYL